MGKWTQLKQHDSYDKRHHRKHRKDEGGHGKGRN